MIDLWSGHPQRPFLARHGLRIEFARWRQRAAVDIEQDAGEELPEADDCVQPLLVILRIGNFHGCHLTQEVRSLDHQDSLAQHCSGRIGNRDVECRRVAPDVQNPVVLDDLCTFEDERLALFGGQVHSVLHQARVHLGGIADEQVKRSLAHRQRLSR